MTMGGGNDEGGREWQREAGVTKKGGNVFHVPPFLYSREGYWHKTMHHRRIGNSFSTDYRSRHPAMVAARSAPFSRVVTFHPIPKPDPSSAFGMMWKCTCPTAW